MADEDFIINIQPTPNFVVELNEQGPQGPRGDQGIQGIQGSPNELAIGAVEKGDNASATITGSYPDQKLNLVLPKGDRGGM